MTNEEVQELKSVAFAIKVLLSKATNPTELAELEADLKEVNGLLLPTLLREYGAALAAKSS